jgi:hypothetical protein
MLALLNLLAAIALLVWARRLRATRVRASVLAPMDTEAL